MTTLRYELRSANPHESFEGADSWTEAIDGRPITFENGVVSADDHDSETELTLFLRSWQLAAYLVAQHEIWFAPLDGQAAIDELFSGRDHVFRGGSPDYPRPDPDFVISEPVERTVGPLRAQMDRSTGPAATAAAVLSALEEAAPSPGAAYNIDSEVLALLRDLVARGAADEVDLYRTYRGPEWQWLQECVRRVMLQVGRARPDAPPVAPLTMASFRTEL